MVDPTTQQNTLDPDAVNLAKAIRQTETGGNFKATGKSGEYGAYQFTAPTWNTYAKKFGVNSQLQQATPEQQNEVAYKQIKEWKDKGYNPGQIASLWNSGKPDAYLDANYKGKNKYGVTYDVPAYAKSVATAYQTIKQGGEVGQDVNNPSNPEAKQGEGFLSGLVSSVTDPLSQLGGSVASGLDKLSGGLLNKNAPVTDQNHQVTGLTGNPVDTFGYRAAQELSGTDTTKQVAGNILQNAANVVLPEAKEALATTGVLRKVYQGAKTFGKVGALQGAGSSLSEGGSVGDAAGKALTGGLEGGLLGGALGGVGGVFGKGLGAVSDSGILQGTKGMGERAKQQFSQTIDSGLGKNAKGTGETMFDYGIDHNQSGNDAAYQIRNEVADKAEQNLTDVLRTQNNYTPIEDWLKTSLSNIKSGTGNYGNIKQYIENHVDDIVNNDPKYKNLLVKNADGGLSLPDWALNELKQQNWINSKFSPLGDPSSTIKAEANLAMGRAGRKIVEKNTKGIDVGGFNKELGRLYNAADVLEKKGDKPIFTEKSSHLISKLLGGIVGSHQGIIGTIVGAQTADAVASQLAKVPMYVRKEIAQKFAEKGKSKLFDDAISLLDKMEKEKSSRLSLPAPDMSTYPIPMKGKASAPVNTIGNNFHQGMIRAKNTLNLPAPSSEPIYAGPGKAKTYKPEIIPAKKGLIGQSPKTGKFFGTYKSSQ